MNHVDELYNYLSQKAEQNGRAFTDYAPGIIKDVIGFVLDKENWGISFKTHALSQMLKSINITEAEIIHYMIDEPEEDENADAPVKPQFKHACDYIDTDCEAYDNGYCFSCGEAVNEINGPCPEETEEEFKGYNNKE